MRLVVNDLLAGVDLRILEDDIRFAIRYQRLNPSLKYASGGVPKFVNPKVVFRI